MYNNNSNVWNNEKPKDYEHPKRFVTFISDVLWPNNNVSESGSAVRGPDVKILLPCGAVFTAHKIVLGAQSRSFGDIWLRDPELGTYDFRSADKQYGYITPRGFMAALEYMYTGCVKNLTDPMLTQELYRIANDFLIMGLLTIMNETLQQGNGFPGQQITAGGKFEAQNFGGNMSMNSIPNNNFDMRSLTNNNAPPPQMPISYFESWATKQAQRQSQTAMNPALGCVVPGTANSNFFDNIGINTKAPSINNAFQQSPFSICATCGVPLTPNNNFSNNNNNYAPYNFNNNVNMNNYSNNFASTNRRFTTDAMDPTSSVLYCIPTVNQISPFPHHAMSPGINPPIQNPNPHFSQSNFGTNPPNNNFYSNPAFSNMAGGMQLMNYPGTNFAHSRLRYKNLSAEEFLALSFEEVYTILSDDYLVAAPIISGSPTSADLFQNGISSGAETELAIFTAAWRWIYHARFTRFTKTRDLMTCVRFPLLSIRQLAMLGRELVNVPETHDLLFDACWYHTCVQMNTLDLLHFVPPQPRKQSINAGPPEPFDQFSILRQPTPERFVPTLSQYPQYLQQQVWFNQQEKRKKSTIAGDIPIKATSHRNLNVHDALRRLKEIINELTKITMQVNQKSHNPALRITCSEKTGNYSTSQESGIDVEPKKTKDSKTNMKKTKPASKKKPVGDVMKFSDSALEETYDSTSYDYTTDESYGEQTVPKKAGTVGSKIISATDPKKGAKAKKTAPASSKSISSSADKKKKEPLSKSAKTKKSDDVKMDAKAKKSFEKPNKKGAKTSSEATKKKKK